VRARGEGLGVRADSGGMRLGTALFLGALLLTVAVLLTILVLRDRQAQALPVIAEVPAFSLTNRDGGTVSRDDLLGHPWVADFIFTHCPAICPRMTQQMGRVHRALPAARIVSFSVDPENDTPAVLDEYARAHGAGERWLFLTGAKDAIASLCRKGFLLPLDATPDPSLDQQFITHSSKFVLVDDQGRIRRYYDSFDDAQIERLIDDLRAFD